MWDSWKCWRNDQKKNAKWEKICCFFSFFFFRSLVGNWSSSLVGWIALKFKTKRIYVDFQLYPFIPATNLHIILLIFIYRSRCILHTAYHSLQLWSCSKQNCTVQPRRNTIWKIINKLAKRHKHIIIIECENAIKISHKNLMSIVIIIGIECYWLLRFHKNDDEQTKP